MARIEGRGSVTAMELPSELWLAIMRLLGSMRDHHAFALTCAFFASLARAEIERAKLRLARETERSNSYRWNNPGVIEVERIVGPCLANGRLHGRCLAYCTGDHLVEFEARDGLRQGEARLLRMPTRQLRRTFCFVDDKLEGTEMAYMDGSLRWLVCYEDGEREGPTIFLNSAYSIDWQYYEHGKANGYSVACRMEGNPHAIRYYEDDVPMTLHINHENDSRALLRDRRALSGWTAHYYSNGSLRDLAFYEDSSSEDRIYAWYDNGQLAAIYELVHGAAGMCSAAWDRHGNPTQDPVGI